MFNYLSFLPFYPTPLSPLINSTISSLLFTFLSTDHLTPTTNSFFCLQLTNSFLINFSKYFTSYFHNTPSLTTPHIQVRHFIIHLGGWSMCREPQTRLCKSVLPLTKCYWLCNEPNFIRRLLFDFYEIFFVFPDILNISDF